FPQHSHHAIFERGDAAWTLFPLRLWDRDTANGNRTKAVLPKLSLNFSNEGHLSPAGVHRFLPHSIYARCFSSLVPPNQPSRLVYPLVLAEEPIEMVDSVCWVVLCLESEAALGFDDIGHTS